MIYSQHKSWSKYDLCTIDWIFSVTFQQGVSALSILNALRTPWLRQQTQTLAFKTDVIQFVWKRQITYLASIWSIWTIVGMLHYINIICYIKVIPVGKLWLYASLQLKKQFRLHLLYHIYHWSNETNLCHALKSHVFSSSIDHKSNRCFPVSYMAETRTMNMICFGTGDINTVIC